MNDLWLSFGKKLVCVGGIVILSGCSTVGAWLGDDEEDTMASDEPVMQAPEPVIETGPTAEEMLAEKDEALIAQGMRIAVAERELQMMQEENSALKQELDSLKQEAEETRAMLEQANESQIAAASEAASANMANMDVDRPTVPDGGFGLHVASYELRDSIAPGIAALTRQNSALMQGRPIKIAQATVRGRNFNRLVIGQFDSRLDAEAECRQALLLISFCEVVDFRGEDY